MFRIDKVIKPWKDTAALNDHINLYGFWSEGVALTKSGDPAIVLRVTGVDYESLDQADQERAVRRLESAMKSFGPRFHIYQYLFKTNKPHIPFAKYDNAIVDAGVEQRKEFFAKKSADLFQVEIFYVVLLEGARSKTGFGPALKQLPTDPAAALRELKAQFTSESMKVLQRTQIAADVELLEQRVQMFIRQMAEFTPVIRLSSDEQFTFLRRLLNFDQWRIDGKPQAGQFLDYQVVNSNIEGEREHLRVGDHFVRLFTMKEAISATSPLVLDQLLKISCNFYAVTEWTPLRQDKAIKEVTKRRKHFNMSKSSFISQANDPTKVNQRDVLIDESKQADIEDLGGCLRELGAGASIGEYSFTLVLYDTNKAAINKQVGEFTGIFSNASGTLFAETYNQLNVFFATIPGNYAVNLRKLLLLNTNYADLSFLFTIRPGEQWNNHLNAEYLAVLETSNSTPYFLNLHNGEVAHTLILGGTGSGKSFFCNFLLASTQKYEPFTYIFDVGGSFESLTHIYGGSYLNVGTESGDFTINPFSLEPTKDNLEFLFSFFRVLIEGKDTRDKLTFKEEKDLYAGVENMYTAPVSQRTITTFASLIGPLRDRLHKWTREGQYGYLFDNVKDTLTFSRFQTFNFAGMKKSPDVLEPLLFYVLHRASNEITSPQNLSRFKTFLIDEGWLFFKNETIRDYVVEGEKTWRKHNAAMILATQSIKELESSGLLDIVAESCPTKIFLANPDMNRALYSDKFHLNDTEINIISELLPPGQMLIRKAQSSKKVQLNVDSISYWTATNNAKDNVRKLEYFERYGIAEGLRRLAHDYPFTPQLISEPQPSAAPTKTVMFPTIVSTRSETAAQTTRGV
jgi:type IV secretion system protein TrbE